MCFFAMNWALKARSDDPLTPFSDKEVQGRLLSQTRQAFKICPVGLSVSLNH